MYTPTSFPDVKGVLVPLGRLVSSICSSWGSGQYSSLTVSYRPHRLREMSLFSRCMNTHSHPGPPFSTCRSHCNPATWCLYKILSNGTTGSCILSHEFWTAGPQDRRIQMVGHPDSSSPKNFGACLLFTLEYPNTASLACRAHPGRLEITSRTVMCHADDPCSVNTACEPESSFPTSPRSTTRPLYVWKLCVQFRVCEVA